MLYKCANPACSEPFLHMRDGKLFRMEIPSMPRMAGKRRGAPQRPRRKRFTQHFWLCDRCAPLMTIDFRDGNVTAVALPIPHTPEEVKIQPSPSIKNRTASAVTGCGS